MKEHKGEIVEAAIKQSGYQIKALAKKLGIARNTLYTKMKEANLDDEFILKIGKIIHYDFSLDLKDLASSNSLYAEDSKGHYQVNLHRNPDFIELKKLNDKYLQLLEDYNKLCKLLVLLANNNDLIGIKKEIATFLENEENET